MCLVQRESLIKPVFLFSVPVVEVQAVIKETANLPCDISIPIDSNSSRHPDDDVILVLWYREDLGRPIYR
jgi:hypothetical protein